jgi:putative YphP/YqiW family bacilliredoxin
MEHYYDPQSVRSIWEELAKAGVETVTTAAEVDSILSKPWETVLVVVNSVHGCASENAWSGVALGSRHPIVPDYRIVVFADIYREALDSVQSFMPHVASSSPSIALFRVGNGLHPGTPPDRTNGRSDGCRLSDGIFRSLLHFEGTLGTLRFPVDPIRFLEALPSTGA